LRVSPRELATGGKPFFSSFGWHPERPANFLVIGKSDGQVVTTLETEAFVSIHHINAFERGTGPNAEVVVDLSAYDDASHLTDLYLTKRDAGTALYTGQFRRYRLPLSGSYADYEVLSSELIELPTIDYRRSNAREYRYAYGASMRSDLPEPFYNQLVEVDVLHRKSTTWFEDGCFPSEAVFVPKPGTTGEDEGVLLSIVLDTRTQSSFLLVLDAQSVTELARAEVPVAVPYSFHGQFLSEAYSTI
jgi:beta,beta-carotene 9',10'-dioxygenase